MRPAWLEIDLGAIRGNYRALREAVGGVRQTDAGSSVRQTDAGSSVRQTDAGSSRCEVIPVVKANAYGHGLVRVTKALEEEGVRRVGVAIVEEGVVLREAGVKCGILVMGASLPEGAEEVVEYGLTQSVCVMEVAEGLSKAAAKRGKKAKIEIKVDTGMGRLGIRPEEVGEFLEYCVGLPGIEVTGIWSHLATADEEDRSYAEEQFERFKVCFGLREKAKWLRSVEEKPDLRFHLCNSAGIVNYPEMWLDGVRPGLLTYGLKPSRSERVKIGYRGAMELKSRLNFVKRVRKGEALSYGRTFVAEREMVVGTVPVGYGDGYPRSLSNRGQVLFRGERARVVGRVCMDQFLVDLSGPLRLRSGQVPDARIGEEVVLIGRQSRPPAVGRSRDPDSPMARSGEAGPLTPHSPAAGQGEITANEVAEWAGTIVNEIVCRMGERLPRKYK